MSQYYGQILQERVLLKNPFEREGSYAFFQCVKRNDLITFALFVQKSRYYLFDSNYKKKTCLHIAAEKGFLEMCKIIIDKGCYLDQEDLVGRTALYYSVVNNHKEIVQLILKSQGSPWIKESLKKKGVFKGILRILKRYQELTSAYYLITYKRRHEFWEKATKAE